jgi:hypothetical protein
MKRFVSVAVVAVVAFGLTGAALAQMPGPMWGHPGWGGGWQGMGPGMGMGMGPGWMMGPGRRGWMMGGQGTGEAVCPMFGAAAPGTPAEPEAVTEDKAKELAQEYVDKYLKGYAVDKVLPFTGRRGFTAYSVELKGPEGQSRILHINPWGGVMPFGGPSRRAG